MTQYNLADRLREPTSYLGIALAIMGQLVPQLVPVAAWGHAAAALHELIGAALFFLPENRSVLTAEAIAAAVAKALPQAYALPLAPNARPADAAPVTEAGTAVAMAAKTVAPVLAVLLAGGAVLSACAPAVDAQVGQRVTSAAATFQSAVAAACTLEPEARRIAAASGDAALAETESYARALCSNPDAVVDPSTPAWVGTIVGTVTAAGTAAPGSTPGG